MLEDRQRNILNKQKSQKQPGGVLAV